eukprot:3132241-Rhodomonas_salina.1
MERAGLDAAAALSLAADPLFPPLVSHPSIHHPGFTPPSLPPNKLCIIILSGLTPHRQVGDKDGQHVSGSWRCVVCGVREV